MLVVEKDVYILAGYWTLKFTLSMVAVIYLLTYLFIFY